MFHDKSGKASRKDPIYTQLPGNGLVYEQLPTNKQMLINSFTRALNDPNGNIAEIYKQADPELQQYFINLLPQSHLNRSHFQNQLITMYQVSQLSEQRGLLYGILEVGTFQNVQEAFAVLNNPAAKEQFQQILLGQLRRYPRNISKVYEVMQDRNVRNQLIALQQKYLEWNPKDPKAPLFEMYKASQLEEKRTLLEIVLKVGTAKDIVALYNETKEPKAREQFQAVLVGYAKDEQEKGRGKIFESYALTEILMRTMNKKNEQKEFEKLKTTILGGKKALHVTVGNVKSSVENMRPNTIQYWRSSKKGKYIGALVKKENGKVASLTFKIAKGKGDTVVFKSTGLLRKKQFKSFAELDTYLSAKVAPQHTTNVNPAVQKAYAAFQPYTPLRQRMASSADPLRQNEGRLQPVRPTGRRPG